MRGPTRAASDSAGAVPDAVAPPPRHPRFPLVDGMRAVAVLAVVGVHSAVAGEAVSSSVFGRALAHLNIGVTIFFLISGFLLYRPFIAHRAGGPTAPDIADYAKRRFLRVYPAYWVVLTVLVIVPGLAGVIDGNWWPAYALVDTLPVHDGRSCAVAALDCGVAQTWSLVVEVTFYAVLPLYALAAARLTRGLGVRSWMRAELVLLAALAALSLVLQFVVFDPVPSWLGAGVLAYIMWFALGMGMAVLSVGLGPDQQRGPVMRTIAARPGLLWSAALGGYALLCLWLPATPFLFERTEVFMAHVAFALIAALLLAPAVFGDTGGGAPRRLLAHPVVAWIGLVSYGIFLWHYVVTLELGVQGAGASFAVVLLGTMAITIPLAALSYYLVERPLLRLKYRRLRDLWTSRTSSEPDPA